MLDYLGLLGLHHLQTTWYHLVPHEKTLKPLWTIWNWSRPIGPLQHHHLGTAWHLMGPPLTTWDHLELLWAIWDYNCCTTGYHMKPPGAARDSLGPLRISRDCSRPPGATLPACPADHLVLPGGTWNLLGLLRTTGDCSIPTGTTIAAPPEEHLVSHETTFYHLGPPRLSSDHLGPF